MLEEIYKRYQEMLAGETFFVSALLDNRVPEEPEAAILGALGLTEWEIAECRIGFDHAGIHITGSCFYPGRQKGAVSVLILEDARGCYAQVTILHKGEIAFGVFFDRRVFLSDAVWLSEEADEKWPWDDMILVNPCIFADTREENKLPMTMESTVRLPEGIGWYGGFFRGLDTLSGRLLFEGPALFVCDFIIQSGSAADKEGTAIHLYQPEGYSDMRGEAVLHYDYEPLKKKLELTFPIDFEREFFWLKTLFSPAITGADVISMAAGALGVPSILQQEVLKKVLPDLSLFGIEGIAFGLLQKEGETLGQLQDISVSLELTQLISLFFPWLTVTGLFAVLTASRSSWITENLKTDYFLMTELALDAEISLFPSLLLKTGFHVVLPDGIFHGYVSFEEQARMPSTTDFFAGMGAGGMEQALSIASLSIEVPLDEDRMELVAEVKDIWEVSAGSLQFCIRNIRLYFIRDSVSYSIYLEGRMELVLAGRKALFAITAGYAERHFTFTGKMTGSLSLSALAAALFGREVGEEDAKLLELTGLELSFTDREHSDYYVTASLKSTWNISLFQEELHLYGQVRYERKGEEISSLLTAGLSVGSFSLTLSARNFDQTFREYLFKIQIWKVYMQAQYQRIPSGARQGYDEILTIWLGGMTLLDMVNSLVGLFNPNLSVSPGSPWDTLLSVSLDRFMLRFNITADEISFLYRIDLDLLGLARIENVGIVYKAGEQKVEFILSGQILDQDYPIEDPIRWDAVNDSPPELTGRGEGYFTLYYLGAGAHIRVEGIENAASVSEAMELLKASVHPEGEVHQAVRFDSGTNWMFGAEFTALDSLHLGLVLCDPDLYGLYLTVRKSKEGSFLDSFAGFYMELLYKKISDTVGMFRAVIQVPERYRTFWLGPCAFTLGQMSLEIYTNGKFLLDMGFPHNRDFKNSFQIQAGIYTGRGGFYFGVLDSETTSLVPQTDNGAFPVVLVLGVGISIGIGRSFDFGIVKGEASLTAVGIFEGVFATYKSHDKKVNDNYVKVRAVAGITGRLFICVDFKIICISASVEISAYAEVVLESCRPMEISVELSLTVAATIKILFIKIHFSFGFSYSCRFTIGEASIAPWEAGSRTAARKRRIHAAKARRESGEAWRPLWGEEIRRLQVTMVPAFSRLDEGNGISAYMAWTAVLDRTAGFDVLTGRLADWVMQELIRDGCIYAEDIRDFDMERFPGYAEILAFMEASFQLDMDVKTEGAQKDEEMEGVFFPVTPWLALTVSEGGKTVKSVDYSIANPVSEDYIRQIGEFFSEWMMRQTENPRAGVSDTQTPIQQFFLTEYFTCLIKGILAGMEECLKDWETENRNKSFRELCNYFCGEEEWKETAERILSANGQLCLPEGQWFGLPKLCVITKPGDSLQTASLRYQKCEISREARFLRNFWLLRFPAQIPISGRCTARGVSFVSAKAAAAVFFVRYYEEKLELENGLYQEILSKQHPLDPDFVQDEEEPLSFRIPAGEGELLYQTMYGDTLERLAFVAALLNCRKGDLPLWDDFYDEFMRKNPEEGQRDCFLLPECTVTVTFRQDLYQLGLKLFPDRGVWLEEDSPLYGAKILEGGQTVDLHGVSLSSMQEAGAPHTVDSFMEYYAVTPGDMAEMLGPAVLIGKIRIPEACRAEKDEFLAAFLQGQGMKRISAMVSRVFMQGLRLPGKQGTKTEALFRLLDQMIPVSEEEDYALALDSKNPVLYVSPQPVLISHGLMENNLPAAAFSPRYCIMPGQSPDFGTKEKSYNIGSGITLYGAEEAGQRTLQIPGRDFAEAAAAAQAAAAMPFQVYRSGTLCRVQWSLFCILRVKRAQEGCYEFVSMEQKYQEVLKAAAGAVKVDCRLYCPAGSGEGAYQEAPQKMGEARMVRVNSTTRTAPVRSGRKEAFFYTAGWNDPEMIRFLWEFSTVQAGGYYLYLSRKLPEEGFLTQETVPLLLVISPEFTGTYRPSAYNCYLSDNLTGGEQEYIVWEGAAGGQTETVCLKEAGYDAFRFALEEEGDCPCEEEEKKEWLARSLYQIAAYELEERNDFRKSTVSYPLLAVRKTIQGKNCSWYEAKLPLMHYYGNGADPYSIIRKTACVTLHFRDLFGNGYQPLDRELHLKQRYHDFIYSISDTGLWEASSAVAGSAGRRELVLYVKDIFGEKLAECGDAGAFLGQRAQMADLVEKVRLQYADPQVELRFTHTLLKEQKVLDKEKLLSLFEMTEERLAAVGDAARFFTYRGDTPEELMETNHISAQWLAGIWENLYPEDVFQNPPTKGMTFREAGVTLQKRTDELVLLWAEQKLAENFRCTDGQKFTLEKVWEESGGQWSPFAEMPQRGDGYRMDELVDFDVSLNARLAGLFREGAQAHWKDCTLTLTKSLCLLELEDRILLTDASADRCSIREALYVQRILDTAPSYLRRIMSWECRFMTDMESLSEKMEIFPIKGGIEIVRNSLLKEEEYPQQVCRISCDCEMADPDRELLQLEGEYGFHVLKRSAKEAEYAGLFLKKGVVELAPYWDKNIRKPYFFALRPLAGKLITRRVFVADFDGYTDSGERMENGHAENFAQIDVEVWAFRFLGDMDWLFTRPEFISGPREDIEGILADRDALVKAVTGQILPVESHRPLQIPETVHSLWEDCLKGSLSEGYRLGAALAYQAEYRLDADYRFSFGMDGKEKEDTDEGGTVFIPGKLRKGQREFAVLVNAGSMGTNCVPPPSGVKILHVESDIQKGADGYESAVWQSFLKGAGEFGAGSFPLYSALPVPIPLRRYPAKPILKQQAGTQSEPFSLEKWDYHLRMTVCLKPQDELKVKIQFGEAAKKRVGTEDLFDCLARYETVREELKTALMSTKYRNKAMKVYARCIKDIAGNWQPLENGRETEEKAACGSVYRNESSSCSVKLLIQYFDTGTLIRTFWEEAGPEGTGLSFIYVKEDGECFVFERREDEFWLGGSSFPTEDRDSQLELIMEDIPLEKYSKARAAVSVTRNENLFAPESGISVREEFIYRCQPQEFIAYTWPLLQNAGPLVWSAVTVEGGGTGTGRRLLELIRGQGVRYDAEGFRFQLEARFSYQISEDRELYSVLPVIYLPLGAFTEETREEMCGTVDRVLARYPLLERGAALKLGLSLEKEGHILVRLENVTVPLKNDLKNN